MTTLSLEPPRRRPGGRILAIEADPTRARALRELFRRRNGINLTIVPSIDEAATCITDRVPDLVVTSPFLPPSEAEILTAHLKATRAASHVQVLIAPELTGVTPEHRARERRGFRARRPSIPVTACNVPAVLEQIDEYLDQAHVAMEVASLERVSEASLASAAPTESGRPQMRLVHARREHADDSVSDILRRIDQLAGPKGQDRRRGERRPHAELPWLWSAKLPSGIDLKVVDASNSGVLVESAMKLPVGSSIELCIIGHERNMSVLARIARTEVAHVDGRGVRYHLGAAFARDLDLLRPAGFAADVTPGALADVLTRALTQTDRGLTAALLCFEQELARLIPVRSVQVRHAPAPSAKGTESVYFSIPGTAGAVLQATFDRDHAPSPLEFKLLRAAANLAAVVGEFVPTGAEDQYGIAAR